MIKLLTKLPKSGELHHRIIETQLQMKKKILDLIKKYLNKDGSPKKRQKVIDDIRLIQRYNNGISKNKFFR